MTEKRDRAVQPPPWALKFLRLFCPDRLLEEIEGDLVQKFERDKVAFGVRTARRRYVWNAVRFFRLGIILRNHPSVRLNRKLMIRNYFIMGWRHFKKDRTFSSISVFGLSVSIAVCLLIFHYGIFELRYDHFNEKAAQTYRVVTHSFKDNELVYESALTAQLAGAAISERLPEVVESARLISTRGWFDCTMKYIEEGNTMIFNERSLYYADTSILSVFSFPLVKGDKSVALQKPFSAVLSVSAASRYFGEADAVGKVLHLKGSLDENDYTVTGVMEDLPPDSHIDAEILLSASSLDHNSYFDRFDAYTYIVVTQGADIEDLSAKLRNFASTYFPKMVPDGMQVQLVLQPITDIHLYSSLQDEIKSPGNAASIYFLLLAAFFILLIAWINHINLATSRSLSRAREVGIRKVSGASRVQLVFQFLSESMIINGLSGALALVLVFFLAPVFDELTGLSFSYFRVYESGLSSPGLFVALVFCAGVFISGWYPAKIISSHNPALVLKGRFNANREGLNLRKWLVVFQFTCAIVLTIAVMTSHHQFRFMQSQDLGVDINKTLVVQAPTTFATSVDDSYLSRLDAFRNDLQSRAVISSVTTSSAVPGEKVEWTGMVRKEKSQPGRSLTFMINVVDTDFISAFDLQLLAGRNFQISDYPGERFGMKIEPVILNRTAVGQLGFSIPEDIIGETIYWESNKCVVVGVIDDFHQQSLKEALQPLLFTANNGPMLSIKLGKAVNDSNLAESVSAIRNAWKIFFPDSPFDYFLLDDFYSQQYMNDKQVINLFQVFCGIAILISSLGLFALSTVAARQRLKEMSIRRVLGAGTGSLVALLTKDLLVLMLVASCLAVPLSWLGMERWLKSFVFHVDSSPWFYIIPVLIILVIASVTVSLQTFKVIHTNPVEILKCE